MERDTQSKARITFDLKQQRIRIYKETLRSLGSPEYIQLLVHPENGSVAVRGVDRGEKPNFRVNWKYLNGGSNSYEFKCLFFLSQFVDKLGLDWTVNNTYRLEGDIYPDQKLAIFHPLTAELVTDGEYDGE